MSVSKQSLIQGSISRQLFLPPLAVSVGNNLRPISSAQSRQSPKERIGVGIRLGGEAMPTPACGQSYVA